MSESKNNQAPYVVLVAIDLGADSAYVLRTAFDLAKAHPGAELHVVTVYDFIPTRYPLLEMEREEPALSVDNLQKLVKERVDHYVQETGAANFARVTSHLLVGKPADEIVWLAAHVNADLLVVGTHGRKGLSRMVLGSVAERITRHAGCAVHVARIKQHKAEWVAPVIEPLCEDCAKVRQETEGQTLWCAHHSQRHIRAHTYSYAGADRELHAYESIAGSEKRPGMNY